MDESILTSIKQLLGIGEDDEHFDMDIIIHINSVFAILTQLGAGPKEDFSISDKSAVWSEFIDDHSKFETIKSYVYLRVRLLFDPPVSSAVLESMNRMIDEFGFRINVATDETAEGVIQNGE